MRIYRLFGRPTASIARKGAETAGFVMVLLSCAAGGEHAGLIKISGAIGPITYSYIERAIRISEARNDACLIVQLDTPGGLLNSTKEIVQSFFSAQVPVVVYIAPSGATAIRSRSGPAGRHRRPMR
jgi:membrane-bound ClpP family serine protease